MSKSKKNNTDKPEQPVEETVQEKTTGTEEAGQVKGESPEPLPQDGSADPLGNTGGSKSKKVKFVATVTFRDKNDYSKLYKQGESLEGLDEDRLHELLVKGYAKQIG